MHILKLLRVPFYSKNVTTKHWTNLNTGILNETDVEIRGQVMLSFGQMEMEEKQSVKVAS